LNRTARPRRSVLYMPGSNIRALDKARSLAADSLILDLEDSVSPEVKAVARANVVAALAVGGYGFREVVIRINGLASPWGFDDLAATAKSGADAVLVPKVESADGIRQVEAALERLGAPEKLAIWAMMETPLAMLRAEEIAGASPRLACLVMGTSDLAKDLHASHTRERLPMITSLGLCLLAARGHGLAILDGVHLDLQDDAGFEDACHQGVELGFDGKTLIHPKTLDAANRAFAPSPEEVAWSYKIIAAFDAALADGKALAVCDGKLIENLHVENAKRVVALSDAIGARSGEDPARVAAAT
jgi:citrate lyase subunit beta/citryl-CoA lyase